MTTDASGSSSHALSVTPSTDWHGDDGIWSSIALRIGNPPQWVDVFVSTVSSETWAVGPGGCDNNALCSSMRGGIFNFSKSQTWQPQGFFALGVDEQLGNTAYANYGLDAITFGSTGISLESSIIGSINDTKLWLGEFGLGNVPGNFTNITVSSGISSLVQGGDIWSHSYGYTAGANYRGFDAHRFVPHNISFTLNPSLLPQVYVNDISVVGSLGGGFNSTQLLNSADKVSAIIDSSTPYLWLPQSVCDRFAKTLGLTFNSTLNLYTFDGNSSQHPALQSSNLTFSFVLSDLSTSPDFVNITLPYDAFDLSLTFPFIPNTTYGSSDAQKPYFPLRPAVNEAQYTIGRVFLQEAYLITDYERSNFSVHQAVHIADPIGNTSIIAIQPLVPLNITEGYVTHKDYFSGAAIAGISVGAIVATILIAAGLVFFYRWRRRWHDDDQAEDMLKNDREKPRSLFGRFRRPRQPRAEIDGTSIGPAEASSDNYDSRFELAAPAALAELDSEAGTYPSTVSGLSSGHSIQEGTRRKLEQQLRAAAQAQAAYEMYPIEKAEEANRLSGHHHLAPVNSAFDSPLISPMGVGSESEASYTRRMSPVSPGFPSAASPTPASPPPVYRTIHAGEPDNVHLSALVHEASTPEGTTAISDEYDAVAESNNGTFRSDPEAGSETIDSTHSISYRTPLSHRTTTTPLNHPNQIHSPSPPLSKPHQDLDDFKFRREDMQSLKVDIKSRETLARSSNIVGHGAEEMIHVPQVAEKRFSWEEGEEVRKGDL